MGCDDAAGLLEIAELEGNGGADDFILPVVEDRKSARPVQPIIDGAIAEFPAGRRQIPLERLVNSEHEMQRPGEHEGSLALDIGERSVAGEPDEKSFVQKTDMVAAQRMMRERMTIIMRRAETDGNARQPCNGLDDPHELGGSKNPAELAMPRCEVRDAHRAALRVGKDRDHHGGVAQIFGLEINQPVEQDVGESLFLLAADQTAEDGITVEARVAPPHQPCLGIEQRRRPPVPDDREIESVIPHEVANAPALDVSSSQRRTSAGWSKQKSTPATIWPTEMLIPFSSGMIANTLRSVTSSPMKIGRRPRKGGCVINSRTAVALVVPRCLISRTSLPGRSSSAPPSKLAQILAAASRTRSSLAGARR